MSVSVEVSVSSLISISQVPITGGMVSMSIVSALAIPILILPALSNLSAIVKSRAPCSSVSPAQGGPAVVLKFRRIESFSVTIVSGSI